MLQERQDLSEKRVQQIATQVEKAWDSLLDSPKQAATAAKQHVDYLSHTLSKAPRRLAVRTQTFVEDFQANIEEYLHHTDKDEFNLEGIKRDLTLLLHDPKVGLEQLGERLSHYDRATLLALLAQRGDLTEAEASQIVDQIETVRQQLLEQFQAMQQRIQDLLETLLEKIRSYLNSLPLPELDYDRLQTDLQRLLNLSQEGVETLGDHLRNLNRDTLTTLLSSRQDISQFVANQVVDQFELIRLQALEQVEGLRQEAEERLQELKAQAQKQAEATRKAAAIAAWWLFELSSAQP